MSRKAPTQPTFADDLRTIRKQVEKSKSNRKKLDREDHTRWRKIAGWVLGFCLLAAPVLAWDGFRTAAGESSVEIAALLEPAQIWPAQTRQWAAARVHDLVASGDVIRTGLNGAVHLRFPDETLVKVDSQTTFAVRYAGYSRPSGGRNRNMGLYAGRMWARVSQFASGDSSFTVNTPAAMAGVRGTRFSMVVYSGVPGVANGATYLSVLEGHVSVAVLGMTDPILVGPGQETLILPHMTQAPAVAPMSQRETAAWQAQANDPSGVLAEPGGSFRRWIINVEEQLLVRPVALASSFFHFRSLGGQDDQETGPAGVMDPHAYERAIAAGQAIRKAMEVNYDSVDGYPTPGLADLAGLNLPPDKSREILSHVDGSQLLSYQKLAHSYLLYLRAKPPSGLLIEVTPEGVRPVDDGSPR